MKELEKRGIKRGMEYVLNFLDREIIEKGRGRVMGSISKMDEETKCGTVTGSAARRLDRLMRHLDEFGLTRSKGQRGLHAAMVGTMLAKIFEGESDAAMKAAMAALCAAVAMLVFARGACAETAVECNVSAVAGFESAACENNVSAGFGSAACENNVLASCVDDEASGEGLGSTELFWCGQGAACCKEVKAGWTYDVEAGRARLDSDKSTSSWTYDVKAGRARLDSDTSTSSMVQGWEIGDSLYNIAEWLLGVSNNNEDENVAAGAGSGAGYEATLPVGETVFGIEFIEYPTSDNVGLDFAGQIGSEYIESLVESAVSAAQTQNWSFLEARRRSLGSWPRRPAALPLSGLNQTAASAPSARVILDNPERLWK